MMYRIYADGSAKREEELGAGACIFLQGARFLGYNVFTSSRPIKSALAVELFTINRALSLFNEHYSHLYVDGDKLQIHVDNLDVFKYLRRCVQFKKGTITHQAAVQLFGGMRNQDSKEIFSTILDMPYDIILCKDEGHSRVINPNIITDRLSRLLVEEV